MTEAPDPAAVILQHEQIPVHHAAAGAHLRGHARSGGRHLQPASGVAGDAVDHPRPQDMGELRRVVLPFILYQTVEIPVKFLCHLFPPWCFGYTHRKQRCVRAMLLLQTVVASGLRSTLGFLRLLVFFGPFRPAWLRFAVRLGCCQLRAALLSGFVADWPISPANSAALVRWNICAAAQGLGALPLKPRQEAVPPAPPL